MKIRPLRDQVIVRQKAAEEKIANGLLYAPQSSQEKPLEGEVLAVGPGRYTDKGERIEPEVKVGDQVLFTKFSTSKVNLEGEEYILLTESAILAILNG